MNLLLGFVSSSGELRKQFVTNFSGTFNWPRTRGDLLTVRKRKGEHCDNTSSVSAMCVVIMVYNKGVTNKRIVGKLKMHNVETVA